MSFEQNIERKASIVLVEKDLASLAYCRNADGKEMTCLYRFGRNWEVVTMPIKNLSKFLTIMVTCDSFCAS